jgi:hypothetical protein
VERLLSPTEGPTIGAQSPGDSSKSVIEFTERRIPPLYFGTAKNPEPLSLLSLQFHETPERQYA